MENSAPDKTPTDQALPADKETGASSKASSPVHGAPELVRDGSGAQGLETDVEEIDESKKGLSAFLRTRNFWFVLVLGYVACMLVLQEPA